jgi:hypothetical protein
MRNKLLIATATLLLAATGAANAFESHARGNLAPGETGRVNTGNAVPGAPGTWSYNLDHQNARPYYRSRSMEAPY